MNNNKHPLNKLADQSIDYVQQLLFEGSIFGGESLEYLISKYKEEGPYSTSRNELQKHLIRCALALGDMEAYIIARAQTMEPKRLNEHLKRQAKKK